MIKFTGYDLACMNRFDRSIIDYVLEHISRSHAVFHTIHFFAEGDNLIKGGIFSMLIWYFWFKPGTNRSEHRLKTMAMLFSLFIVMIVTLGIAGIIHFRTRPFLNPAFVFTWPDPKNLYISELSSFPSDHAALFISLSTGLFFISRKWGLFAFAYTSLFILFPRIYLGYHYPTDILAGGCIGAVITSIFLRSAILRKSIIKHVVPIIEGYPNYFYPFLFLLTYEVTDLFAGSRNLIAFILNFSKH